MQFIVIHHRWACITLQNIDSGKERKLLHAGHKSIERHGIVDIQYIYSLTVHESTPALWAHIRVDACSLFLLSLASQLVILVLAQSNFLFLPVFETEFVFKSVKWALSKTVVPNWCAPQMRPYIRDKEHRAHDRGPNVFRATCSCSK